MFVLSLNHSRKKTKTAKAKPLRVTSMSKFTVTYSPAYEFGDCWTWRPKTERKECALYTWGQPGSLEERQQKNWPSKVSSHNISAHPLILFSFFSVSICSFSPKPNVQFNYHAPSTFIDLLFRSWPLRCGDLMIGLGQFWLNYSVSVEWWTPFEWKMMETLSPRPNGKESLMKFRVNPPTGPSSSSRDTFARITRWILMVF